MTQRSLAFASGIAFAIFSAGLFNMLVGGPVSGSAPVAMPAGAIINIHDGWGIPPERFRGDRRRVPVSFLTLAEIRKVCGPDAGACVLGGEVFLPNPCEDSKTARAGWDNDVPVIESQDEYGYSDLNVFQTIVCHELGHVNGWSGEHWAIPSEEDEKKLAAVYDVLFKHDQIEGGQSEWGVAFRTGLTNESAKVALERLVSRRKVNVQPDNTYRLDRCEYWSEVARRGKPNKRAVWCAVDDLAVQP